MGTRTYFDRNEDKAYLMYLLSKTDKIITNIRTIKFIFLIQYRYKKKKNDKIFHYAFVKWHNGPYDKWIQNDMNALITSGLVEYDKKNGNNCYQLTEKGKKILVKLKEKLKNEKTDFIDKIINDLVNRTNKDILSEVYSLEEVKDSKFGEKIKF